MLLTQALTAVALTVAASAIFPLASHAHSEIVPEVAQGRVNMFVNVPVSPSVGLKGVMHSNLDSLYSIAWLDLTQEPLIIAAPKSGARFYLLPMLDMWNNVFASPGWRTTGKQAGPFLVTPPGWAGTVPAGLSQLPAPASFVWIIGRARSSRAADYAAVQKSQAGYTVTPLSQMGKKTVPISVKVEPVMDMQTSPTIQVRTLSAAN
jgi:hypothetical protein